MAVPNTNGSPSHSPPRKNSELSQLNLEYLETLNRILEKGWTANVDRCGRVYYTCHATQTTQWIPPTENWDAGEWRLPYGWECAVDQQGRIYYINHLDKFTTYDDPRLQGDNDDESEQDIPTPREVTLQRDSTIGFGFVAGSEKPVIVRFVNEDGPSAGKLLPSDQILKINGEDVERAPRDHVIELVRACKETVTLLVCQPQSDNASRKSAFLSAAKKAKLKSKPSRVRFADGVMINGPSNVFSDASQEMPPSAFIPNVLKVFLENGQTKSFKYDNKTTVRDVIGSLREKLSIVAIEHFALVVESVKAIKKNQVKLLSPDDTIAKIAARPGAQHLRCLFRVTFIPRDAFELLRKDPIALDYFYMQCCNDVIDERFATELRCDVALRLAALQMQQHSLCNTSAAKVSVKRVEKECGLERFIPPSIMEAMKAKELRRLLSHLIKVNNQQLLAPGQKKLSELQVKVQYLKILSELPTFGGRCFNVIIPETKNDGLILISPKFGVSQISGTKTGSPVMLTELESISEIVTADIPDAFHSIELHVKVPPHERFCFEMESSDDLDDIAQLLNGYHQLFLGTPLRILVLDDAKEDNKSPGEAPAYYGPHVVYSMPWSYPAELKTVALQLPDDVPRPQKEHIVNFASIPSPPLPSADLTESHSSTTLQSSPTTAQAVVDSLQTVSSAAATNVPITTVTSTSADSSPQTHVEINLSGDKSTLVPPDVVRNMRFIDDSTSSDLDTPVAERALRRSLQERNGTVLESEVIRYRPNPSDNLERVSAASPRGSLTGQENTTTITPDLVKRVTTSRSNSTAELAAQLSRLQTPSSPNGGKMLWGEDKLDLPSDSEETDSLSTTPTESPVHKANTTKHRVTNPPSSLFRSGSSFGLHSPEDVGKFNNDGIHVYIDNVTEMEMNRAATRLDQRQTASSLYLDPDIIDLCQIPIPELYTNEDPMVYSDVIEVPPTPFRDPLIPFPGHDGPSDREPFQALPGIEEDAFPPPPPEHVLRSMTQNSRASLDEALNELNSFIDAMTVPDPEDERPRMHRVTSEDIRMLVIPPPPGHPPVSATTSNSSERRSTVSVKLNGSPESPTNGHGPFAVKPPLPPKPKIIPPPPPPRNKSLERSKSNSPSTRNKNSHVDQSEAFKDCVAEINAQLTEIAVRKGTHSSESDLVSTTPSASEENTPVMWRKNPVLNCRANNKPPRVGGVHPNATLPFGPSTKPSSSQLKYRPRTRPPAREKLRKRLAATRAQNPEGNEGLTNGLDDEEEDLSPPGNNSSRTAVSGPSGITRVDIQSNSSPRSSSHRQYETDAEVIERVSNIISEIDWTLDSISRPDSIRPNLTNMRLAKEELIAEARRFVTASKSFVKSATVMLSDPQAFSVAEGEGETVRTPGSRPTSLSNHSHKHVLFHDSLVKCTDLIGMMFHSATLVARYSPTVADAGKLVEGILLVAVAFRSTIQTAFRPPNSNHVPMSENSLHDPAVKLLMSEATKLAASLTALMKTIRSIENMHNGERSAFAEQDEP
ncbi:hypothetical protein RvY_09697 [Ramazzottius varieornatus]|uniref:FERM and PDZ domain-containing protein 4 n=1 Tax=Ramazzottius varieornatus TaxID=947166 RepID=A0A1D1VJ99_RAMVA|nr:hypothetical protein RvY_09697 [Ramazzottius varieornatus]